MRVSSPATAVRRPQPLRISPPQALRRASRLSIAEGALVLMALYALVGAGIGAIAGSVLVGMLLGLFTGMCAVAAILLISGSALGGGESIPSSRRELSSHR